MYGEPLRLGGHPLRANGRVCRVAPGALSVPPYVSESCVPGGGSAGGSSIVMVCWVPGPLSLGCSFATLSAAHREMHSRFQPQEQETSQRHSGPGTIFNQSGARCRLRTADDRMVDAACEEECQSIGIDSPYQRPNPKRLSFRRDKL